MYSWIRRNKVLTGIVTVGVVGAVSYLLNNGEQVREEDIDVKDGDAESVSASAEQEFKAAAAAVKANPDMDLSDQQVICMAIYGTKNELIADCFSVCSFMGYSSKLDLVGVRIASHQC